MFNSVSQNKQLTVNMTMFVWKQVYSTDLGKRDIKSWREGRGYGVEGFQYHNEMLNVTKN